MKTIKKIWRKCSLEGFGLFIIASSLCAILLSCLAFDLGIISIWDAWEMFFISSMVLSVGMLINAHSW